MSRRLWLGWVQLGTVLVAAGIAMLMSGFLNHSTEYPTSPSPAGAAAPVDRATGAQLPANTAVLTFDGAPDGGGTLQLLDALRRAGVRATFFVTGSRAIRHPQALRQITEAGHEIGNGTFTFQDLAAVSGPRRTLELAATQSAVIEATGTTTALARPYGPADPGDTLIMAGTGALAGYLVVPTGPWSPAWSFQGADATVDAAVAAARSGQVITLPATAAHVPMVLDALPRIVQQLRASGYTFATVSGALGQPAQASMTAASAGQAVGAFLLTRALLWSSMAMTVFGALLVPLGLLTIARTVLVTALAEVQARSDRRRRRGPAFRGPVSIIVPAYNEEANIAATLNSLLASDYPDFEVVVVDDGSTDRTPQILAGFADRAVILRMPNGGKAAALNHGLAHATHEIVVMVDGDTVFEPGTLGRLVADLSDPEVGAVAGNTKVANRAGFLGRWQHLEYVVGMNLDRRMFQLLDCMPTVPGAIGAFRRAAVRAVGGVPTRTLAEDTDLTMAINLAGWRVTYAGSAVAWTEAPSSIGALARQRYRWCYGTLQAMWFHRRSIRPVRRGIGDGRVGHVGSRGIPYLAMFQVAQPLIAPLIDIYLVYAILFIDPRTAIGMWLLFTVLQLISAGVALRMDGESLRALWTVPTTQILYRQLLYAVVIQSVASAVSGARLRWHTPPRTGAVAAGAPVT